MNLIKSPFNIYDVLSYLSNGFVLITFTYFLFYHESTLPWKISDNFILSIIVILFILFSYIAGHLISMFSSLTLEKLIIRKILGYPSNNFFATKPIKFKLGRKIFGLYDYKNKYDTELQKQLKLKFKDTFNMEFQNKVGFNLCFHYVKEHSNTSYNRLLTFISIYGFCRNICLNFFIIAILLFLNHYIWLGLIALPLSYLFFLRYIKFFKQYGDEGVTKTKTWYFVLKINHTI